ncbi:hypothetical protein ACE38W_01995 [Chitinophaga sp. Hz27]|uniref:hypothetical protein n=1 Tax=Chitinophaga sp. Hz27 TaxID=3347169 RepID=UPI0035E24956
MLQQKKIYLTNYPMNRIIRFFSRPPVILFAFILLAGVVLCAIAAPMNYYTDMRKFEAMQSMDVEVLEPHDYWLQADAMRTRKAMLEDLGSGLIVFALTLFFFCYKKQIRAFADLKYLQAKQHNKLLLYANLAWLALIPAMICYGVIRSERGDYSPYEDIGTSADAFIIMIAVVLLLLPINIFLLTEQHRLRFPAALFYLPKSYSFRQVFQEIKYAVILLLNLACLVFFIIDGNHLSIPICLYFTYILLQYRAGRLNMIAS